MRKVIEILRLKHETSLSHEQIAGAIGLSEGTVGKHVDLAKALGITWPLPEGMNETELESKLFRGGPKPTFSFIQPDFPGLHPELKRNGVTLRLLWAEYAQGHGQRAHRHSRFCARLSALAHPPEAQHAPGSPRPWGPALQQQLVLHDDLNRGDVLAQGQGHL